MSSYFNSIYNYFFVSKNNEVDEVNDDMKKSEIKIEPAVYNRKKLYVRSFPPNLTLEIENKLKNMFKEVMEAFEEVKPANRVNFLNYGYVTYKLFELLELKGHKLDSHKKNIRKSMIKDPRNLIHHDQIWKDICAVNNWKFIPTIPQPSTLTLRRFTLPKKGTHCQKYAIIGKKITGKFAILNKVL